MPVISRREFRLRKPDNTYDVFKLAISYNSGVARGERADYRWGRETGKAFRCDVPEWLRKLTNVTHIYARSEKEVENGLKELAESIVEAEEERSISISVTVSGSSATPHKAGTLRSQPDYDGAELAIKYEVVRTVVTMRSGKVVNTAHQCLGRLPHPAPSTGDLMHVEHYGFASMGFRNAHAHGRGQDTPRILDYTPERFERLRDLCVMLNHLAEAVEDFLTDDGLQLYLDGEKLLNLPALPALPEHPKA